MKSTYTISLKLLALGASVLFATNSFGAAAAAAYGKEVIRLADKKTLTDRLNGLGFEHFVEKTTLVKDLADQEKYPLGVVIAVDLALGDYGRKLNNDMVADIMYLRKNQLIKALLKDHPEAIASLKKSKILE